MKTYGVYVIPILILGIGWLMLDRSIDVQWFDTYYVLSQGHLLLFIGFLFQVDLIMMSLRGTRVLEDRQKRFFFMAYTILSLLITIFLGFLDHQEIIYGPFADSWKAYTLGIYTLLFLGVMSIRWTLILLAWARSLCT